MAQIAKVTAGTLRDKKTPGFTLTLSVFDDNDKKVGTTWVDVTSWEVRTQSGKLRKETELFYALYAACNATDVEEFIDTLPARMVLIYGSEYFNDKAGAMPVELRNASIDDDKWQTVYVNAEENAKRDLLLEAGLRSRFMVQRMSAYRG